MKDLYNTFNSFLREKFSGKKVRKIPIDAGFECPNKNGSISHNGCVFCDQYGSGPVSFQGRSISEQIEGFIGQHRNMLYLAYYQAHSNTYAAPEILKKKYSLIFNYPEIVGLFIGTRPDCINQENLNVLAEFNKKTYLSVELGLQSIHEKSLAYLNRNHTYNDFLVAYEELVRRKIDTVVHLILGIPGEDRKMIMETVSEMNRIKPRGLKLHMLHILRDTRLFELYRQNRIQLFEKNEYVTLIADILERLDPETVIHRLTGERDRELFVAPFWALNKIDTINSIRKELARRKSHQGKFFTPL